jgi:hypothetical protein
MGLRNATVRRLGIPDLTTTVLTLTLTGLAADAGGGATGVPTRRIASVVAVLAGALLLGQGLAAPLIAAAGLLVLATAWFAVAGRDRLALDER